MDPAPTTELVFDDTFPGWTEVIGRVSRGKKHAQNIG
jgi:hypothetical protein